MEKIELRQIVETQPREGFIPKTPEEIQAAREKSARIKDNLNAANRRRVLGIYR